MRRARLVQQYTQTHYEVQGLPKALHVGLHDAGTDRFLASHGATCAAVLSAYNPGSMHVLPTENRHNQEGMERNLQEEGYRFVHAVGKAAEWIADPEHAWPPDVSVCIFDVSMQDLNAMMVRYRQNAALWFCIEGAPSLALSPLF